MKKALLGTSAIALAGAIAAPANAADWNVRVGGYYNAIVGYAQTNGNGVSAPCNISGGACDFDGFDVSTNTEIFFLPRIVLDNGIQIGANVQLEAETGGDPIDESYVQIKGSFGELNIGSENSAGYKMTYAAPNAAIISLNSPSTGDYIAWSLGLDSVFRGTLGTTFLEVERNNDAKRLTYYTPRFAGFQLGVSYAHDALQDNFGPTDISSGSGNVGNIFDIGANYVQSFGDFNVAASARYGVANGNNVVNSVPIGGGNSPTVYSFGLNLGYAGFTIGGSFAESNQHNGGRDDGTAYDIGGSYATGPWTFSLTYFNGRNSNYTAPVAPPGPLPTFIGIDKQQTYGGAVDYKLAKGVRLNLFGAYVDYDSGFGPAFDVDGWVIATGIGLSF